MAYWEQIAAFASRFLSIIPHYSHLNGGLQQAILTPVSSCYDKMKRSWQHLYWLQEDSSAHVVELETMNLSLDSITSTGILSASHRKFKHSIYFYGKILFNWKEHFCMCNHISFRACNNELNDDVFCLLLAKSLGFQWAFKFKPFLHFCSSAWNWDVVVFPIWQVLVFGDIPICFQNDFWALSLPLIFAKSSQ